MDTDWTPNLFIPGFAKCGTTELCNYLSQHPDVFVPWKKEPNTFYDLDKYPAYFSGDSTGKGRQVILKPNQYSKLYLGSDKYRYRVDGTVSYTFDPKFARVLKNLRNDAKVIILIRDQKQRLASMYLFSFLRHRQENFLEWLEVYFVPYLQTYSYYDKIVEYYDVFKNQLRIIELSNLGSPQMHNQLFEFLDIMPIKINVTHKNPSLLTMEDSLMKRSLILGLSSIKSRAYKIAKSVGLETEFQKMSRNAGEHVRKLVGNQKNDYSKIINMIPSTLMSRLEDDYAQTIDFAISKGILLHP